MGASRRSWTKHNKKNDRPYGISVSAGFASFEAAGTDTFEEWLHRADTMMYEQKRQKKEPVASSEQRQKALAKA